MSTRKNILLVLAAIFAILAVVFYFASIKELDRDSARYLGISSVANIQGTVFAAACAVLCGINLVGAIVIGAMEDRPSSGNPSSAYVAKEVANELKRQEEQEKQKQEKEKQEQIEREKQQEAAKKRMDALKARKKKGEVLEEELFIEEIQDSSSMMEVWKIWEKYHLSADHEDANAFIQKYKDAERLYGKLGNFKKLKEELCQILMP